MVEGSEPPFPPPSERLPLALGTALSAVLFVVGLIFRADLDRHGRGWWVWAAACGVGVGLLGFTVVHRRALRMAARANAAVPPPTATNPAAPGSRTPDRS